MNSAKKQGGVKRKYRVLFNTNKMTIASTLDNPELLTSSQLDVRSLSSSFPFTVGAKNDDLDCPSDI